MRRRRRNTLEAAKWAAQQVIEGGRSSIHNDYRGMFSALSLAGNPEVIMYRVCVGLITHSLHTYVAVEAQTGVSKNLIDSYLMRWPADPAVAVVRR
jgi:hypothetical protein